MKKGRKIIWWVAFKKGNVKDFAGERQHILKKTELVHTKEMQCTVLMRKPQEFSATIKSDLN